jgi:hypothetical protein
VLLGQEVEEKQAGFSYYVWLDFPKV